MGLASVAVYSDCDRASRHVRMADEAVAIGPSPPSESYLRIDRVIDAARAAGADAVHPGYGFLAENEAFATACRDEGLTFIGPSPEAIRLMGAKTAARRTAIGAGVPVVPGTEEPIEPHVADEDVVTIARQVGYPLIVKAVAGGGGKGMRVAQRVGDLAGAVRAARSEAQSAFGDAAVYLERRLERPRHIEVQILADHHGTLLPFVERECSIQRRHQKVIEESPSPVVSPDLRRAMTTAAAAVARSVGYTNAGTIEFLVDEDGRFYFLEMNTRLQVEHPVTEIVSSVDLVRWQIAIARGDRLDVKPDGLLRPRGHAIECRIYAEDPNAGFLPSPGRITALQVPHGPGIRNDSGTELGADIPIFYDALISKLVAWGADRGQAISRMARALREYEVVGVSTTIPFLHWMLRQRAFVAADFHTGYLDELLHERRNEPFSDPDPSLEEVGVMAAALHAAGGFGSVHGRSGLHGPVERRGPRVGDRGAEAGWRARARLEGLRD